MTLDSLRSDLAVSMSGATNALTAADLLCRACVDLLGVDGASISIADHGTTRGTFGSSGELSRRLDEYQFTFGEGPCLDAVRSGMPVSAIDLRAKSEQRWPAFTGAVLDSGIHAVFALPVALASSPVGALDLYNRISGPLSDVAVSGGMFAAELAALPLMDVLKETGKLEEHADGEYGWDQLVSLQRVEVYQATGMIIAALGVNPAEALLRLRAYAYSHGVTASELAWQIVERQVDPGDDEWRSTETIGGAHHD